jgi:hypothetical protein
MVVTPTMVDLLNGCVLSLATPPRPEDAGLFSAARNRLAAMINKLVALECADAAAIRLWENAALRALIAQAGSRHGLQPDDSGTADEDYSLPALDAANARLRRQLIRLHEAAEQAGDAALDRKILNLYREMARRRELDLPPVKPMT